MPQHRARRIDDQRVRERPHDVRHHRLRRRGRRLEPVHRQGCFGRAAGAYQPGASDAICQQNLVVGDKGYFRSPCVANSEVGGTDDWVLHNVNAGTVPVAEMTVFDQLPTPGDTLLISGTGRGSTLRPELLAGSLKVAAPAGTTQTVEVTTSTGVCVNTWSTLTTAPVCEQNGEKWTVASDGTDWSKVTGIRVHLDFRTTPAKALTRVRLPTSRSPP